MNSDWKFADLLRGLGTSAEAGIKAGDDALRAAPGQVNHAGKQLAVVQHRKSPMTLVIESLKRKGVFFDIASFQDGEVTHNHHDVTFIGGEAAEVLHRAYECAKGYEARLARGDSQMIRFGRGS